MGPSKIREHVCLRLRLAAYEAELIARSHDMLAQSQVLLQQEMPTTFLGEKHSSSAASQRTRLAHDCTRDAQQTSGADGIIVSPGPLTVTKS